MIPQYNAYQASGAKPFLFNQIYDISQNNEANLYDNVYSEFTYLHGSDIVYLPREVGAVEKVFGEYLAAVFDRGFPVRLFIEEVEAWGGNGDIYSKFGLQVQDECTLFCNKQTFRNASISSLSTSGVSGAEVYPKQGDLVYVVKAKKLFEVSHIEDQIQPGFFLFGNKPGYKISCKMFSYNHEAISQSASAGIPSAVQALDALLTATEGPSTVKLEVKDETNNNVPIRTQSTKIVDTTEQDPLA